MAVRFGEMDERKSSRAMINEIDTPFAGLTPDLVLDAATSVGLDPDGRLFALNSYENRVYQLGSAEGSSCSSSIGRRAGAMRRSWRSTASPPRLAAAELPVAAPVAICGAHAVPARRFPLRRISLDARATRRSSMRPRPGSSSAGRSRACTRSAPAARSAAGRRSASNAWALRPGPGAGGGSFAGGTAGPLRERERDAPGERSRSAYQDVGPVGRDPHCTATATWGICCGRSGARSSSTSTIARWGRACRTYG